MIRRTLVCTHCFAGWETDLANEVLLDRWPRCTQCKRLAIERGRYTVTQLRAVS